MAIGLARMFGIRSNTNFNSPFKATSIIDFWRRWHITLSRFLRDYLYIPLGGNRKGEARRFTNLMIAMLLGGLWHGAGWNFVLFGLAHGTYIVICGAWVKVKKNISDNSVIKSTVVANSIGRAITFLAVVLAFSAEWNKSKNDS
jgi:D-alanyl-lipoteichoic acid acyltransferase DltB (MBOAT superfamily)